jgi:hypothetical protein
MPIPKEFLDILACPFCKSELSQADEKLLCSNPKCNLRFSIRENIPVMLIDEAERPCPKCSAAREWKDDQLVCSKCGETLKYEAGH